MIINGIKTKLFKDIIIPKAKNLISYIGNKFERQPAKDVVEINLIENTPGIKSATFRKFLTQPEFTPKTNLAKSGAKITTIIDKKTQKPVEAFVARAESKNPNCEKYVLMVKDRKGDIKLNNEKFRAVGITTFYVNKKANMITPKFDLDIINGELYQKIHSNMKSLDNKDFAGIGLRLHQLRVERMLQNNLGNVCIVAEGNSFPFHYSMGYRLQPRFEPIERIKELLNTLSGFNNKPPKENAKFVIAELKNNKEMLNVSASIENCLNDYYKRGGEVIEFSPNMYLEPISLNQWVDLIQKQPILY